MRKSRVPIDIHTMKITVSDRLVEEARKLGNHRTKKEAVIAALKEYVARLKQQEILKHFGTIEFDERYDYKRERGKR